MSDDLTLIKEKQIPALPLVRETSYSSNNLGKHKSVMRLYCRRNHYFIEWDIPALEEVEHIGLVFDGKTLVDYDGVMSLPSPVPDFLRGCGFIVPADMA